MNEEKFKTYEEIRGCGATNMFDVKAVVSLSDGVLDRDDCLDIMQNYNEYKEKYSDSL